MAKHEFGIIDYFEENKWYSVYEPEMNIPRWRSHLIF